MGNVFTLLGNVDDSDPLQADGPCILRKGPYLIVFGVKRACMS